MKNDCRAYSWFIFRFAVALLALCLLTSANLRAQNKSTPLNNTAAKTDLTADYSLIDGDLQMPSALVETVLRGQKQSRPDANYRTNLWPGIVPYEFDANVTVTNRSLMREAMTVLEATAQIVFAECQSSCSVSDYVHIQNSTGNNSPVGRVGGKQIINISSWTNKFTMVHELMHSLGIFHEQSRPDRGNYIKVECGNVQGGCEGDYYNNNFKFPGDALIYNYYDFDSVMHYDQCGFSIDCDDGATCSCTHKVITVLPPNQSWQNLIGQRTHLSTMDKTIVSFLYPANNWTFLDCSYDGGSGTPAGTFQRPYTNFFDAYVNTPAGGTIWLTKICYFAAAVNLNKPLTIKAAPGVIGTFGN